MGVTLIAFMFFLNGYCHIVVYLYILKWVSIIILLMNSSFNNGYLLQMTNEVINWIVIFLFSRYQLVLSDGQCRYNLFFLEHKLNYLIKISRAQGKSLSGSISNLNRWPSAYQWSKSRYVCQLEKWPGLSAEDEVLQSLILQVTLSQVKSSHRRAA